ncbi:MAG: GAF domain-containing protein [Planctomycetes bacterium]|nr:GAF domain-containing protein [Planctomycetota bacterium]
MSTQSDKQSDTYFLLCVDMVGSTALDAGGYDRLRLNQLLRGWLEHCLAAHNLNYSISWSGDGGFALLPESTNHDSVALLHAALAFTAQASNWVRLQSDPTTRVRLRCILAHIHAWTHDAQIETASSFSLSTTLKHERSLAIPDALTITDRAAIGLARSEGVAEDWLRNQLRATGGVGDTPSGEPFITRNFPEGHVARQSDVRRAFTCYPKIHSEKMSLRHRKLLEELTDQTLYSRDLERHRSLTDQGLKEVLTVCQIGSDNLSLVTGCQVRMTYFHFDDDPYATGFHATDNIVARRAASPRPCETTYDEGFPSEGTAAAAALSERRVIIAPSPASKYFKAPYARHKELVGIVAVPVIPVGPRVDKEAPVYGILCVDFDAKVFSTALLIDCENNVDLLGQDDSSAIAKADPIVAEIQIYAKELTFTELYDRLPRSRRGGGKRNTRSKTPRLEGDGRNSPLGEPDDSEPSESK